MKDKKLEYQPLNYKLWKEQGVPKTTICQTCRNFHIFSTSAPEFCEICLVNKEHPDEPR